MSWHNLNDILTWHWCCNFLDGLKKWLTSNELILLPVLSQIDWKRECEWNFWLETGMWGLMAETCCVRLRFVFFSQWLGLVCVVELSTMVFERSEKRNGCKRTRKLIFLHVWKHRYLTSELVAIIMLCFHSWMRIWW